MKRYINADRFIEYLGFENTEEERDENVGEIVTLQDFDNQIAEDVQEVKHGKWLVKEFDLKELEEYIYPYDGLHGTPFCSMCGRNALLNGAEEYVDSNYCPHCGTMMDKE